MISVCMRVYADPIEVQTRFLEAREDAFGIPDVGHQWVVLSPHLEILFDVPLNKRCFILKNIAVARSARNGLSSRSRIT